MKLTNDYIRGLIDGEGCFSFCTVPHFINIDGITQKQRVPAFLLTMNSRDRDLIIAIRDHLGLRNRVYEYRSTPLHMYNKSYKRGNKSMLIVRDFGQLKNIIVPFFYGKLKGYKSKQFIIWLDKIGNDPTVVEDYKLIYRLHKSGFYLNDIRFE